MTFYTTKLYKPADVMFMAFCGRRPTLPIQRANKVDVNINSNLY